MPRAALLVLLLAAALVRAEGEHAAGARRSLSWRADEDEERLPGWKGEVTRKATRGETYSREDKERGTWVELIAWRPRAYVIHNFMTAEECKQVIKIARPFMARSTVVDSVTGASKVDPIRTRRDARDATSMLPSAC